MHINKLNMIYIPIIASTFVSSLLIAKHNPIIIQVSPPRCLSTASLRMWQARGDCEVLNEAFISAFIFQNTPGKELTNGWWRDEIPHTYDDAWQKIVNLAENKPVFVKEMSFSLIDYLTNHSELIQNQQVYFIFLIRNPHNVISSYYQGHKKIIENFCYLTGFKPCYEIYQMVQRNGAHKPIIICAEDLYTKPYETVQDLCKNLDISFMESMLHWQNLGDSFNGIQEWHELKHSKLTHHWHGAAIQSTGFHEPTTYEVDKHENPTFSEVINEEHRKACFEAYNFNKEYYELFLKEKSKTQKSLSPTSFCIG